MSASERSVDVRSVDGSIWCKVSGRWVSIWKVSELKVSG
jgi:hypothetical protein